MIKIPSIPNLSIVGKIIRFPFIILGKILEFLIKAFNVVVYFLWKNFLAILAVIGLGLGIWFMIYRIRNRH